MSKLRWGKLHSNEYYQTLHRGQHVVGWVVKIEGRWIARLADASVRVEFDTIKEAKQFLTVIVGSGENNG